MRTAIAVMVLVCAGCTQQKNGWTRDSVFEDFSYRINGTPKGLVEHGRKYCHAYQALF